MREIQVPIETILEHVKQELGEKGLQIVLLRAQVQVLKEKLSQLLEDAHNDHDGRIPDKGGNGAT